MDEQETNYVYVYLLSVSSSTQACALIPEGEMGQGWGTPIEHYCWCCDWLDIYKHPEGCGKQRNPDERSRRRI